MQIESDQASKTNLLDILNQGHSIANVVLIVAFMLPCLYRIETAAKTSATKVETLSRKISTLEKQITARLKDPEAWQNQSETIKQRTMDLSTESSE